MVHSPGVNMKAHEAAKKLNIPVKEFLAETGLKSHLNKVPDAVLEEYELIEKKITESEQPKTVDSAETIVVGEPPKKEEPEECPFSLRQIEVGNRCLGNKSPTWKWRHLLNG
jgi:CRISPR/Cas system-associated endonuclease/helicase Cas3